ncbi:MAG: thioredoxin family protein [Candidatus Eremiobacteraeota bacterium]|nr:thioredoxin family protein [Candidatus Eremiobacteraeota bacterium]
MEIEILGSKDARTQKTVQIVKEAAGKLGVLVRIKVITNPRIISQYGMYMLPAIAINEEVKISGRIPSSSEAESMIKRNTR